jgi:hypothetical protein
MKEYCELFYRSAPEILDADWDVYYDWIKNADKFALQRALTRVCSYVNSGFRTSEDVLLNIFYRIIKSSWLI